MTLVFWVNKLAFPPNSFPLANPNSISPKSSRNSLLCFSNKTLFLPRPCSSVCSISFNNFSDSLFTSCNFRQHRLLPPIKGLDTDSGQTSSENEQESDGEVDSVGVKAALAMLNFYKREISPVLPNSCRYLPTCSEYSMIAYKKYGVLKGTILTAYRLCRCNPLGGSGFDPPRWFDEINQLDE